MPAGNNFDSRIIREGVRAYNERIVEALYAFVGEKTAPPSGPVAFMCECANTICDAMMSIPLSEFRRIADTEGWFATVPRHAIGPDADVLERLDGHAVVAVAH